LREAEEQEEEAEDEVYENNNVQELV